MCFSFEIEIQINCSRTEEIWLSNLPTITIIVHIPCSFTVLFFFLYSPLAIKCTKDFGPVCNTIPWKVWCAVRRSMVIHLYHLLCKQMWCIFSHIPNVCLTSKLRFYELITLFCTCAVQCSAHRVPILSSVQKFIRTPGTTTNSIVINCALLFGAVPLKWIAIFRNATAQLRKSNSLWEFFHLSPVSIECRGIIRFIDCRLKWKRINCCNIICGI